MMMSKMSLHHVIVLKGGPILPLKKQSLDRVCIVCGLFCTCVAGLPSPHCHDDSEACHPPATIIPQNFMS